MVNYDFLFRLFLNCSDVFIFVYRQLAGEDVPQDWQGGMNVTYKFGNTFKNQGWCVEYITIHNKDPCVSKFFPFIFTM